MHFKVIIFSVQHRRNKVQRRRLEVRNEGLYLCQTGGGGIAGRENNVGNDDSNKGDGRFGAGGCTPLFGQYVVVPHESGFHRIFRCGCGCGCFFARHESLGQLYFSIPPSTKEVWR
jgi:hypothetical protein